MLNFSEDPHRRRNILTGEWVLVSPHRTKRPWQGKMEIPDDELLPEYDPNCYLCPGNKRASGQVNPKYTDTFAFANDFSALLPDTPEVDWQNGLLRAKTEPGICRVICFSPNHSLTLPEMEEEALLKVVKLWRNEFEQLRELPNIRHIQIFENKGKMMGCSNPHPHGQIWAQRTVPGEVKTMLEKQRTYFKKYRRSLLGDYLDQELLFKERIVLQNQHFVALVPFWAVWPFETMIIPKRHYQDITQMTQNEQQDFARIIKGLTIRYDNLFLCSFPYSAGLRQQPVGKGNHDAWHFHMSFYPPLLRSATVRKFMVGYEMFASPQRDITAEQAAARLRDLPDIHYKLNKV